MRRALVGLAVAAAFAAVAAQAQRADSVAREQAVDEVGCHPGVVHGDLQDAPAVELEPQRRTTTHDHRGATEDQ